MSSLNAAQLKSMIIARANSDEAFRKLLLDDPQAAIESVAGGTVPADFVFDPSSELELNDAELALVTGGVGRKVYKPEEEVQKPTEEV
jgi:hypothetical protein